MNDVARNKYSYFIKKEGHPDDLKGMARINRLA